jgi:hypothetical protein
MRKIPFGAARLEEFLVARLCEAPTGCLGGSYKSGSVQSKQRSLTAVSVMHVSNPCLLRIGSMIDRNAPTSRFVIGMIGANHISPQ